MKRHAACLVVVCLVLSGEYVKAEEKRPEIRFGLQVAQQNTTVEELQEVWKEAEALGFDSLWTNDHLLASVGPSDAPELEAWTLLAAMATVTSRVQIGTMVTSNTFRHPAVLAKMASTVDHLSNGRLVLGIGAGWFANEHKVYGVPFPSLKNRSKALEESLEVIIKLWSTDPTVSFKGQYYTLADAPFTPKPVQQPHPPILIGGIGETLVLPLVAKYAQMWNIPSLPPDQIAVKGKVLEAACKKVERNCAEIEWSYLTPVYIKTDLAEVQGLLQRVAELRKVSVDEVQRSVLAGDPASIKQQMQAYIDVGVTHFIINLRRPGLYDLDGVRLFAKEVIPAFRKKKE